MKEITWQAGEWEIRVELENEQIAMLRILHSGAGMGWCIDPEELTTLAALIVNITEQMRVI